MVEQDYEKAMDSLKQDVRELRAAFTRWAKENGSRRASEKLDAVKDRLRQGMERGSEWVKDAWGGVHDGSRKAVESTREQLTSHPFLSVTGALLLGVIIDRLLLRR